MKLRLALLAASALFVTPAVAQQMAAGESVEHVVVYGTLPGSDIGLSPDKVPGALQSLSPEQITTQHGGSLLSALGSQTAGVNLSDVQGNGLLQNLRFHGFDASPLQGTPQGLAVYQNGVRLNEAFGDTVNWDAIPEAAIARMDVWSSNPVFGLNALGGAVNLAMKNGFTWQGAEASLQGGSYGHGMASAQWGMEDGAFSFYGAAEGVTDEGWRFHSGSNLARLYADAGWRFGMSEIHLVASGAATSLGVVGPTPFDLIQRNSKSVYTFPQTTRNTIGSLALNGKTRLDEHWQLEASAYVRSLKQRHVDGNDADFERCSNSSSFGGRLCLQDDAFTRPVPFTGAAALNFRNQFAILDQNNASIAFTPGVFYGTVDRSFTDSTTHGATLQITGDAPLGGLGNYFTAGISIDSSAIGFRSTSSLARISPSLLVATDPALVGSGSIVHANGNIGYAPVTLGATTNYYGFYAVDALDLTEALTLTVGLRINAANIVTRDRSGAAAELNGSHGYGHINPLAGLTYKISDAVTLFGSYSQANRAPTPLELDCANPNLPCLLEGSLVSDPPLQQVVAHSYQAGARGGMEIAQGKLDWSISLFRTDSDNDIVALASTIAGRGYFTNVPSTQRQGLDLSARYATQGWSAYASYSYLDATYQFTGTLASPNNPNADNNGNVSVTAGRRIPLNPANSIRAGGDVDVMDGISLGGELAFTGSQVFRRRPIQPQCQTAFHGGGQSARRLADRPALAAIRGSGQSVRQSRCVVRRLFRPFKSRLPGHPSPERSPHPDPAPAGILPARVEGEVLASLHALAPGFCSLYMGAMLRLTDIKLPLDHRPEALKAAILKKLKLPADMLLDWKIFKRAHDARNRNAIFYIYTVDVTLKDGSRALKDTRPTPDMDYKFAAHAPANFQRPLVIGAGPCGLFAALILAQSGFRPIILERGKVVRERTKDTWGLWRRSVLDPESNVQFGEGGAGTFSDGKLYSQIKDPRHLGRKVLTEFVQAGAPEEILTEAHPHIGTFRLVTVVESLRKTIEDLGGEYRFKSKVVDLLLGDTRQLRGVKLENGEEILSHHVVLALGHSARDTCEMLHDRGVAIEAKPFSIGFRIEHPQGLIDKARFGRSIPELGAAEYRLVHHAKNGRSVYSFCMCPGGTVVAATSEEGRVATNGMSQYSRNERNANAGIVVGITPQEDYPGHPLAGIALQRQLESAAFVAGGSSYAAPAQLVGDFIAAKASTGLGEVVPSYRPGVTPTDLSTCLPGYAIAAIREALSAFGRQIKGFDRHDAVLTGVETRTSSPLRIRRGDDFQSLNTPGLYPAGEGAGFAGGILSAAIDGIKVAEAVAKSIAD